MDLDFLQNLNYLAILVSGIAYWILGALWYSPVLFGKVWSNIVKPDEERAKKTMVRTFTTSAILMIIIAFFMALMVTYLVPADMMRGIKIALVAGVGFMMIPAWISQLYMGSSMKLVLIDSAYHILGFVLTAIILTSWT